MVSGLPTSDLEIAAFFLVSGVDKVEQTLRTVEARGEGRERASFVAHHSSTSKGLGQSQHIGVDTDHDAAVICLHSHSGVHQLFHGITELAGRINATLAATLEKALLELRRGELVERR